MLQYTTTSFGSAPEDPPKEKRKTDQPISSLKLLAAKEFAKLLQSNYMDTFDADPHAVMAEFDLVVDPEVRTCIASKLLKTYKAQITAKNITLGITLKRDGEISSECTFSNDGRLFAYSRYYGRDQMNAQGDVQGAIRALADINRDDIQIMNAHTGELLYTINNINVGGNPLERVTKLCFDNKNKALAVGYKSGNVQILAIHGQGEQLHVQLHDDKITCLSYHPDNKTLASGSKDGSICLVNVTTGQFLKRFSTAGIDGMDSRPFPVWEIVCFFEDGGIVAQAGSFMPWFNGNGTLHRNVYRRCYARQINFVNDYYMWDDGDSDLYDGYGNKVHTLCAEPHRNACMSSGKSMMAVEFDNGMKLYRMPTLQDLSSSLSPVQALYVANRLKEQNQSVISKAASSMMSILYAWLYRRGNHDAEQERKELFDNIHASLPEEFKRVLISGNDVNKGD